MTQHRDTRTLPYSPQQLFDLVADVAGYPEFVPWVSAARIRSDTGAEAIVEIDVRFAAIEETVVSRLEKQPPTLLTSSLVQGPLEKLDTRWRFSPAGAGTEVTFEVDYAFSHSFFEALSSAMFDRVVSRTCSAFENRADELYGNAGSGARSGHTSDALGTIRQP